MMYLRIILLLTGIVSITADLSLNVRMKSFLNPYGLTLNGVKCADRQGCTTFFRFCLKSSGMQNAECKVEFESDIIGRNSITSDQFQLTTDLVELRLATVQYLSEVSEDFVLLIEVLNGKLEQELVGQFTVDIKQGNLNQWESFSARNNLNQELEVDYRLTCASFFEGSQCEKPVCSTGCKNGGKCEIVNGFPTCKCNKLISTGDFCEIRVLHSCRSKCMNGASCLGNGECLCPPGYSGSRCQIKRLSSHCGQVTCYNGGTCMIDNQNEYSCICHSAFTGKFCDTRISTTTTSTTAPITSTTTEPTGTTVAQQTSTMSPIRSTPITKNTVLILPKASAQVVKPAMKLAQRNYSFQEIVLIVILGIGMPIFAILCSILLCRLSSKKVKLNESSDSDNRRPVEKVKEFKKDLNDVEGEEVTVKRGSFIQNNLFDQNALDETKVCVSTISCSTPKKLRKDGLNLMENNIYSVYNCAEEKNLMNEVNTKNLKQMQSCQEVNEYGFMASMV